MNVNTVWRLLLVTAVLWIACGIAQCGDTLPKSLDPRVKIQLFAESPQIVTPTDVDVDYLGRVWALESNTHFRPANYRGHASDRLLVFRDDDHDGKADHVETFADGFVHAMSVAVPFNLGVFVATRMEVIHLADTNRDGKADSRSVILHLDTLGDYPHNGLAGFAFDGLGFMYIGLGENLGASYRLIGSDGRSLSGGGEGGSLFRCRPDGSDLTLWATGFWNPHASCVDAFGRMFTVDNDPDYRPPCRLLHIIPGGDYGYRFRNGRRGIHPFTAWDGELPGTLPMVAGTGEAPSGIVAYESDGLPEDYRGNLLVTSWGDYRIDRFRIQSKGSTLTSKAEPLIVGNDHFRPVGLALAPDGSLFATDWVLKDYHLHGQGRIWRISANAHSQKPVDDLAAIPKLPNATLCEKLRSPRMDIRRLAARTLAKNDRRFLEKAVAHEKLPARARIEAAWANARLASKTPSSSPLQSSLKNVELAALWPGISEFDSILNNLAESARVMGEAYSPQDPTLWEFLENAKGADRFEIAACIQGITRLFQTRAVEFAGLERPGKIKSSAARLILLLAARASGRIQAEPILKAALADPDFSVRRTAIQWVGEERLQKFRPEIERQLSDSTTTADLFEAALASLAMLDGVKHKSSKDEASGADYALRLVMDEKAGDDVRARALRMVPANQKGLNAAILKQLLANPSESLRYEALQTLRETVFPQAPRILRVVAADEKAPRKLRLEAITGLAATLQGKTRDPETIALLCLLLKGTDRELQVEALRALRRSLDVPEVRADTTAMAAALRETPNPPETSGELADQLALAFRASALPVPKEVDASVTARPQTTEEWTRITASGGNAEAGRRLFEHPNAGGCFRCHTINGRGGKIGPDLSVIARSANREKLAISILQPSKEVAPQFTTWTLVTSKGRTFSGLIIAEDREGKVRLGTNEGEVIELNAADIEERRPQTISVMPEKLVDSLSPGEFRDLVAYLATLK